MDHLFRSLMFVPGHNAHMLEKAAGSDADVLLPDLEDSVQPAENKNIARETIATFVTEGKFGNKSIYPRINNRESGHLLKDLLKLTINGVEGFMYPKATCGEDIYFVCKLLETIEYEKGIPIGTFKLIPLIETAGAVVNIKEICSSSNRVVAVAFGCEDFVTDMHGKNDIEGQSIYTPRSLICLGARACGVIPIDTVHIHVHDFEDLEKNLILSRKIGFDGMLVLNPKELPLVNKYYSPSEDEIAWANEIVFASEEAYKTGQGVSIKGKNFVGPPMVARAKNILKKARMCGCFERAEQNNE